MKKLEFRTPGLQPLTPVEEREISGGWIGFLRAVGVVAIGGIISDWDNFKAGLTGRAEHAK